MKHEWSFQTHLLRTCGDVYAAEGVHNGRQMVQTHLFDDFIARHRGKLDLRSTVQWVTWDIQVGTAIDRHIDFNPLLHR